MLTGCSSGAVKLTPQPPVLSPIKHVFTIILENQAYDNTFGPQMPVPYLTKTVAGQGALVENYYGTSHFSLGNYLSLVSGEAVTKANQDDCTNFGHGLGSNYVDIASMGVGSYGQVAGVGCLYPSGTLTVADQLAGAGYTWKGYMEDMGNDPTSRRRAASPSKASAIPIIRRRRRFRRTTTRAARKPSPINTQRDTIRSHTFIR
jgi:hypothetical protein